MTLSLVMITIDTPELVDAGAGLVERRGNDSFRWVTLTDPDGNQFCVSGRHDAEQALT